MVAHHIELAKSLPPRLIRFFARYPPPALLNNKPTTFSIPTTPSTGEPTTSSTDPNAPDVEPPSIYSDPSRSETHSTTTPDLPYHNPFLPRKNFVTGKWWGPVYGLRKQADLVKLASKYGVVDLLPYTIKKPGEKEKRRIERGLQVKGTGVGQTVKGKKWERTLRGRLEMRRQAMLNMPALIQEWKRVCAYNGETEKCWIDANALIEGTWTRLEEVAKWKAGEVVNGGIWGAVRALGLSVAPTRWEYRGGVHLRVYSTVSYVFNHDIRKQNPLHLVTSQNHPSYPKFYDFRILLCSH